MTVFFLNKIICQSVSSVISCQFDYATNVIVEYFGMVYNCMDKIKYVVFQMNGTIIRNVVGVEPYMVISKEQSQSKCNTD